VLHTYEGAAKKTAATEKKRRVLFPRDKLDKDVEIDPIDELPENCHNFISDLWADDIGDNTNVKWESIL